MEQSPSLTEKNDPKIEKRKFKATIVDTTDLMKDQAIDVGNEKMTIGAESEELAKTKGFKKMGKTEFWSRLGQKIWKYGLKRNYNLNKEIYKASQEILETKNVFVGEGKGKESHDKVMSDILDQFTSGYDEAIHKEAGEKKIELGKDELEEEATGDKESVKNLIKEYATGKIDKASFQAQEERLFHNLKGNVDEKEVKENTMYASNLFEVAEQVKLAIKNKEFLENEDFELDVIYGKSKAGVRTKENFNKTEKIMDKLLTSKVGQFANETTLAIATSCILSLLYKSAATLPGKLVPLVGTALISSGFAKKREEMEQIRKRTAHFREMAKGETFNPNTMPVRNEMESTRYQTESAPEILQNIDTNLKLLETNGAGVTEQELSMIFGDLTKLEALIRLSDRRRIDLITYSDSTKVVEERLGLDIKKRQLKDALQKAFEGDKIKIPAGQKDFESYFNSLATTEENRMIGEEDIGIDAQDRKFNKMKHEKGNKAAWTAFKTGLIVGATMQELTALTFGHQTGIFQDIAHDIKGEHVLPAGVGVANLTSITYLKHLIQGDLPKMNMGNMHEVLVGTNHVKLPEGVNMLHNADGSYDLVGSGGKVFAKHLTTNADGTFTPEAKNFLVHNGININSHLTDQTIQKSVSPNEHIKTNPAGMKDINHRMWYDQNTAKFDENELRTQLGGIKGTGFDAKGNVVLNVSHMTPDGSFHNELSANAQELMKNGQLKMLFSMSNGTQNKVFEFTVTPKGEIIIPPDSDCAKFLWSNVNGHATFHGRFGEVAQDMGNGNYRMLGTMEGKGLKDIIDTIHTHSQETLLQPNGSYDWTPPPFIPIVPGDPLEKLSKEKKAQEAVGVKDRSGQDKKPGDVIIGPVGPWSTEENKKKIELSQEEYNAMADDVKMLNRKRQLQDGIATITEADFKSAYGKKRYNDLKHFADGIPAEFNHTELLVIGDEIENILRNAKIIKKEDINGQANSEATLEETEKQKLEKNNVRADLEMLNKKIQSGEGIATLIEDDFQSEYGKNRYNILKHFAEATFNKDELEKIATEMEKILVGSRKIVAPVAKESTTANNTIIDYGGIDDSGTIKKQEKAPIIPEKKETPNPKEIKISGLANPSSGENTKVKPKIQAEEIKPSAEKSIPIERKFTAEDLSRIGTEFESKIGSYKVTRVFRPGLFGKKKIEVLFKDEKGKDHPLAYDKKELEGEFKKGNIKITKAGN